MPTVELTPIPAVMAAHVMPSAPERYAALKAEDQTLLEIEKAFDLLDTDKNRKIDRDEFKKGISKLQLHKPKGAAEGWKDDAFDRFDVTRSGSIDYDEFCFAIATLAFSAKARGETKTAMECFQEALGTLEETQSAAKEKVEKKAGSINDESNEEAARTAAAEAVVEIEKNEMEDCHNGWGILIGLAICPCALGCISVAKSVHGPRLSGLGAVVEYVTSMKDRNAHYVWTIQNYHYEKRTAGSGKNKRTKRVRVNTHYACTRGGLVCSDESDVFVPNTRLRNTALASKLEVEIVGSFAGRFDNRKNMFYNANRRDKHQDTMAYFELPGMHDVLRAEWVGGGQDPCWVHPYCCCLASVTFTAACWFSAMRGFMGAQTFAFEKSASDFA